MTEGKALTCVNCKRDIRLSGGNWVDSQDFANCKAGPHVPTEASLTTLDKRINELVKALEAVWAGVPDKLRAQLDDESLVPMDVTSIPVLYGTLRLIRAALTAAAKGGKG